VIGALEQLLSDISAHIPRWQLYGALAAAVGLWIFRQYALAKLVIVVAFFAWLMAYAVDNMDLAAGVGANAWQLAILVGSIVIVIAMWVHFVR